MFCFCTGNDLRAFATLNKNVIYLPTYKSVTYLRPSSSLAATRMLRTPEVVLNSKPGVTDRATV
jgi:hypothetical protein